MPVFVPGNQKFSPGSDGGGVFVPSGGKVDMSRVRGAKVSAGGQVKVDMSRVNAGSGGVFVPSGGPAPKVDMSRVSGGRFAPRPTKSGGGFLGGIAHLAGKTGSGLYHAAVNLPGGLYETGKTVGAVAREDIGQAIHHPTETQSLHDFLHGKKGSAREKLGRLEAQTGRSFVESAQHPLRDPASTLLNLGAVASLGAGTAARLGEAGRVAGEGAGMRAVARAAVAGPAPGVRRLTSGGVMATAPASRAALTRGITKASDVALQKWAKAHPEGRAATVRLPKKVGTWNAQQARVAVAVGQGPALALRRLGRKLTLPEQTALQVAAEGVPLREQLAFAEKQLAAATSKQAARRHRANVNLLRKAAPLLNDTGEAPRLLPAHLQRIYGETAKVSRSTDQLRENLGLITPEAARARIAAPGRIVRGAKFEQATLAERPAPAFTTLGKKVRPADRNNLGVITGIDTAKGTARVHFFNRAQGTKADVEFPLSQLRGASRQARQQGGLVGAEVSAAGDIYIPSKAKLPLRGLGRPPMVGATGAVSQPRLPGTVTHPYTGALKQAGRERHDVTNLVAEHALETQRYGFLQHVRDTIRPAVHSGPPGPNDIVVRLDKLGAGQPLPQVVQDVLAKHESGARLTREERNAAATAFEKVRKEMVPGRVEELPQDVQAQLDRLLAEGRVGFVNRHLLGGLDKTSSPLAAVTGSRPVRVFDAINNAQKGVILYLKPAYAVPNLLGNVGLNLVQQGPVGFARTLTRTAVLSVRRPDLAARIDPLMGEGIAQAIGSEAGLGQRAIQAAANAWSKPVDTPFRRSAFLYEASREGYRTPAQLEQLLTDPDRFEKLAEVTRRANREIIDYGNLGPRERELIRRVVFFYPWVRGATVYAGHFATSHPLQAAAAQQLGTQGYRQAQQDLGPIPSYLEGIFRTSTAPSGNPLVVNPAAAAILQTPAQVAAAVASFIGGRGNIGTVGDLSNLPTPALQLLLAQATHQGPTGRPERGGLPRTAWDILGKSTPQYQLYQGLRGRPTSKTYPAPTTRGALARFLVGGLYPREANIARLHQQAGREKRR